MALLQFGFIYAIYALVEDWVEVYRSVDDGQIVIVSEYAPDGSLDKWLKTHGKMSVEKSVDDCDWQVA